MRRVIWDYQIPNNWRPKSEAEWEWFLVRKINYGDWQGISQKALKKFFPKIKDKLDPGKREMIKNFLKNENSHT
jgi:hypothetical protein